MKCLLILAYALCPVMLAAQEQAPAAKKPIAFAVSTVKPAKSDTGRTMLFFTGSGISIANITLKTIIRDAYGMEDDQLMDVPAWVKTARFDMEAKVDDVDREAMKKVTQDERTAMLRTLIENRFHLKAHTETRELAVLNLVVGKGGLKMKETAPFLPVEGRVQQHGIRMGQGVMHASDCPMELFAKILAQTMHHLVVDKTGLAAHYDFELQYTEDDAPADQTTTAPSLTTALQEQLGLRLDAAKAQMPVLVIDSVERPTED